MSKFDDLFRQYGDKRHGSAGLLWTSATPSRALTDGRGGAGYNQGDPRYFEQDMDVAAGDGGTMAFKPTEYFLSKMKGRAQVRDGSRLIDPNAVEFDPEFGITTDERNIRSDEDWLDKYGLFALAAPAAVGTVMSQMGLAGLGQAAAGGAIDTSLLSPITAPTISALPEGIAAGATTGAAGGLSGLGASALEAVKGLATPGNLIRAGLAGASLAGMNKGSDSGGGGGGGSSEAQSIIDQMANANRFDHNTALGSRKWSKGPDGRWTVTDSMDPAEEANFRNVQGMNADVTGMARQRLAELLTQPKRARADAPLSYGMFNIGG